MRIKKTIKRFSEMAIFNIVLVSDFSDKRDGKNAFPQDTID
jgi:hypothetical protein